MYATVWKIELAFQNQGPYSGFQKKFYSLLLLLSFFYPRCLGCFWGNLSRFFFLRIPQHFLRASGDVPAVVAIPATSTTVFGCGLLCLKHCQYSLVTWIVCKIFAFSIFEKFQININKGISYWHILGTRTAQCSITVPHYHCARTVHSTIYWKWLIQWIFSEQGSQQALTEC